MSIRVAATDAEIAACHPVMRELRPHVEEGEFVARIRRQEQAGYRLAYLSAADGIVAVAGFRVGESLAWGRFLYVDDLVTLPARRSQGHGAKLLSWLRDEAARQGCQQMHLDSGIRRKDTHRFYEREGMSVTSLHFVERIGATGNAS
ncbi:MAG: GNAT family N-acetyltransferase [Thermodesulfobacteriota bacterium]